MPDQPNQNQVIWFINHYAITPDMPGGTRHFDLACELTQLGYDVTIFASAFNHKRREQGRLSDGEPWAIEEMDGVKFVWLPAFAYQGNDWRRMVNMLDFAWRAYVWGSRLPKQSSQLRRPDVVIGCAVHLFAVLAGYHLARRFDAHFLMEVRDLWPQTFLDMGVWREGQIQVRVFRRLEQFLYARAERIITLSPLTRDYLARYSEAWAEKVVCIPNATKISRFEQAAAGSADQRRPLRAMYLGAMGITNGLDLILQALVLVNRQDPGLLECVFVGNGPEKARLRQMALELGLDNVHFEDAVPRAQVPDLAAQADLLMLVQKEVLYGSSNKLYDYMAAGKSIVVAIYAEHNNPVNEAQCGLTANPDSAEDLAAQLQSLALLPAEERQAMGERGRAFAREHHDYSVRAKQLAATIRALDNQRTDQG